MGLQRHSLSPLGLYPSGIFFILAFILNIIANVIRIIVLVCLRIPSETPMHEFAGILCLVVYVMILLHLISYWLVRKYGEPKDDRVSKTDESRLLPGFCIYLFLIIAVV